jgi:hypothetical protein
MGYNASNPASHRSGQKSGDKLMQAKKPTREEREKQLRLMFRTGAGKQEVQWLFLGCFPLGVMPPAGSLLIQTILDQEYKAAAVS